jgi:hypothetical protein
MQDAAVHALHVRLGRIVERRLQTTHQTREPAYTTQRNMDR